jgi:hypothetical protein
MKGFKDDLVKIQSACFEGNVMNKFVSWDIGKSSYKCFQANLVDHVI